MRLSFLIASLAVAASIGLSAGSAWAQFEGQGFLFGRPNGPQAPWCAHNNNGADWVEEDCSFGSFEACRQSLMGVSSSFCTPSAAYDVNVQPNRRSKGNRLPR